MVSLRPGATADEDTLRQFVHDRIGTIKTPEVIAIRDELPQTDTGKILRRAVRAELVERVTASPRYG